MNNSALLDCLVDIAFISKYIHLLGVAGGHASNSSENVEKKGERCHTLPCFAVRRASNNNETRNGGRD